MNPERVETDRFEDVVTLKAFCAPVDVRADKRKDVPNVEALG
jgi:hypothetical protein